MTLWLIDNGELDDEFAIVAVCTSEESALEIKKKYDNRYKDAGWDVLRTGHSNIEFIDSDKIFGWMPDVKQ